MAHLVFAIARPFCAEQKIKKVRDWQWLDDLDPRCECCDSVRGPGFDDASVVTHLTQHETLTSGVDEDILFPCRRPKLQWQCAPPSSPPPKAPVHQAIQPPPCAPYPVSPTLTLHHLRHHSLLTSSPFFLHIYVQEELRPGHSAYCSPPDRAVSHITVSLDGLFRSPHITQLLHPLLLT